MRKFLEKMSREELIEVIGKTGTEKYLDCNIQDASIEDLRKVASIVTTDKRGMTGLAKLFFVIGLVLLFMFVISIIRAHWVQSIVELIIAIISLSLSSILHIGKGIKSLK